MREYPMKVLGLKKEKGEWRSIDLVMQEEKIFNKRNVTCLINSFKINFYLTSFYNNKIYFHLCKAVLL